MIPGQWPMPKTSATDGQQPTYGFGGSPFETALSNIISSAAQGASSWSKASEAPGPETRSTAFLRALRRTPLHFALLLHKCTSWKELTGSILAVV
jgi:hypothetical protein